MVGELIGMRECIDRFVTVLANKEHVFQLVKKLDLVLKIEADHGIHYLLFRDGKVDYCQFSSPNGNIVTISGNDVYLEQLFDGDLKLIHGVKMNYFKTDCPFRVQLVLESLFYLTRPLPL